MTFPCAWVHNLDVCRRFWNTGILQIAETKFKPVHKAHLLEPFTINWRHCIQGLEFVMPIPDFALLMWFWIWDEHKHSFSCILWLLLIKLGAQGDVYWAIRSIGWLYITPGMLYSFLHLPSRPKCHGYFPFLRRIHKPQPLWPYHIVMCLGRSGFLIEPIYTLYGQSCTEISSPISRILRSNNEPKTKVATYMRGRNNMEVNDQ